MNNNDFLWLVKWYAVHCNGDWEHGKSIHIGTIDNPGWSFSVNLNGTELENISFDSIEVNRSEENWLFCRLNNGFFEADCGINNLFEVINIFRKWASKYQKGTK